MTTLDQGLEQIQQSPTDLVLANFASTAKSVGELARKREEAKEPPPFELDSYRDTRVNKAAEAAEKPIDMAGKRAKIAFDTWRQAIATTRSRFETVDAFLANEAQFDQLPRVPLAVTITSSDSERRKAAEAFWTGGKTLVVDQKNQDRPPVQGSRGSERFIEYTTPENQVAMLAGLGALTPDEASAVNGKPLTEQELDAFLVTIAKARGIELSDSEAYELRLPTSTEGFDIVIRRNRLSGPDMPKMSDEMLGATQARTIELDFEKAIRAAAIQG